jgi:hypothetical protein
MLKRGKETPNTSNEADDYPEPLPGRPGGIDIDPATGYQKETDSVVPEV